MDTTKIRKHNDVLREIAKVSEAIRRKQKMIKLNNDTVQQTMGEMLKPLVTPMQELVDTSKQQQQQQQLHMIKQETKMEAPDIPVKIKKSDDDDDGDVDENLMGDGSEVPDKDDGNGDNRMDDEGDDTLVASYEPITSTPIRRKRDGDDSVFQYLKMFDTASARDLDMTYGVRKLAKGMMIGDSKINFADNLIYVGEKSYGRTPGLLELLFKKSPNPSMVTEGDRKNYINIVTMTNAQRKYYQADRSLRDDEKSDKYKNFVAQHVGSPQKSESSGKGLTNYEIARAEGQRMDYVYWNDPNELVDRLRLLKASQAAGNTSHSNEISSIIEELREAKVIY